MKPFNLDAYLANPNLRVVTRDGCPVRILCTDRDSDYPIVGLIENKYHESWNTSGCVYGADRSDDNDLFFDVALVAWINVFKVDGSDDPLAIGTYPTEDEAKKAADVYLGIASRAVARQVRIEWED